MKNAVKRQRLPNQQQAKQCYTPLVKTIRMLKAEWLCFSSSFHKYTASHFLHLGFGATHLCFLNIKKMVIIKVLRIS